MNKHEQYEDMKTALLTEEELERGRKNLDYYREAWMDKDNRGLFDTWQECERYWEGNVNEPEYDDDPASNTNITHPTIEGQVVLMVDKHTAIDTYKIRPSAQPFLKPARIMLNWIKENNSHRDKQDEVIRRFLKFGNGIIRVLFNPKFLDGFGIPEYDSCHPAYVFFDPNIVSPRKIQEGRFVIETVTKSTHWAERVFGERAKAIEPGYNPIEDAQMYGEDEGNAMDSHMYIHMFVFERTEKGIRFMEQSACGVILYDSDKWEDYTDVRPVKPYFPKSLMTGEEMFPYFIKGDYPREGTIWSKSDTELLFEIQDQINDYDDQTRSNARITGNPQKWVDISSGIDPEMWTNERGLVLPTNGGKDGAGYFQPPQMSVEIINRRDRIVDRDRALVTRFSDQMMGSRIKGVDTATEALSLQQSGMQSIDYKKGIIEELFSEVFEYCLQLAAYYWDEEQYFYLMDTDEAVYFKASVLNEVPKLIPATREYQEAYRAKNPNATPPATMILTDAEGNIEYEKALIGVKVRMGAGLPQNKAFKYSAIKEARAIGDITPEEHREYLRDEIGLDIEETPPMMPGTMPGQPGQPNRQQPTINPEIPGLTNTGNPKKPQSEAKRGMDSVARVFR